MNPGMLKDADENFRDQNVGDPVNPCGGSGTLYHVRVVEMDVKGYEKVLGTAAAASSTHDVYKVVHKATRDQILQEMKDSERGDILTSDTHTYIPDKGKPEKEKAPGPYKDKALGICGYKWHALSANTDLDQVIWLAEMCGALKVGTAPTAAVIIGCRSFDLLKGIIVMDATKVALGIQSDIVDVDVNSVQASAAAMEITAALMRGESIQAAADAGQAKLSATHHVKYVLAAGVSAGLSLAGNKLL